VSDPNANAALEPQRVWLRDASSQLEAAFIPTAGMLCCSLRHRGQELLAHNAGVLAYAQRGKTMGIPLLYPWANRLAAFDYTVSGRAVRLPHDEHLVRCDPNGLPIHGVIGGQLAWELLDAPAAATAHDAGVHDAGGHRATAHDTGGHDAGVHRATGHDATRHDAGGHDAGASSLLARLSWSEERPQLFAVFPFSHELHYRAHLSHARLQIEVEVHACGEDVVPVCFGFHPYLTLARVPRERWLLELPAMRALELDDRQIPTGDGRERDAQRFELGERALDDGFDSLAEHARFRVSGGGRSLELWFLDGYTSAQVFAPTSAACVCFEPMTAPTNALRSGAGLRVLAPGERFTARFAVVLAEHP
jgi:aldose 1-epimerase